MPTEPTDLWEDMDRLNMLYEELCLDHMELLEFNADFKNNQIIIRNKTMDIGE